MVALTPEIAKQQQVRRMVEKEEKEVGYFLVLLPVGVRSRRVMRMK